MYRSVCTHNFPVARNCIGVHRENMVEQSSALYEAVEVNAVLLVPKHGRNVAIARSCYKPCQRPVVALRMLRVGSDLVPPAIPVSEPSRLD
ncbi:hypothetical protein CBM2637_B110315 [Cupriavidus taiwanensis]|nr:hypothetical protein CBM2637_B110315 [Cupriavidus taiwanensis]